MVGRGLHGGGDQKSPAGRLPRAELGCQAWADPGTWRPIGACASHPSSPQLSETPLVGKALPFLQEGAVSGSNGRLGPRGPRDPPPGMR